MPLSDRMREILSTAPITNRFVDSPEELVKQEKNKAELAKLQAEVQGKQADNSSYMDTFSAPQTKAILGQTFNAPVPLSDMISGKLDNVQSGIDTAKNQVLADQTQYGNGTVGQVKEKQYGDYLAGKEKEFFVNPKDPLTDTSPIPKPGYVPASVYQKIKPTGSQMTANPTNIDIMADMIMNGKMAPSQLPGFGANSLKAQVLARVAEKANGNYDFTTSEANFGAKKTYANTMNSGGMQNTIKYLDSVTPNLNKLVAMSNAIPRTQFPPINSLEFKALMASGDPQVAAYGATITEVSDQIAKILQGGGTGGATSDAKLKQAQELLNSSFTPEQIQAVAGSLTELLGSRRGALMSNTYQPFNGNKVNTPASTNPNQPQNPQQPGSIPQVGGTFNGEKVRKVTKIQ